MTPSGLRDRGKPVVVHQVMHPTARLYQRLWITSVLCWALVSLMPVINAHSSAQGVWESLCTLNGFKLVKIDDGKLATQSSKPCPFGHFTSFHYQASSPAILPGRFQYSSAGEYVFLPASEKYKRPVSRAPPRLLLINS